MFFTRKIPSFILLVLFIHGVNSMSKVKVDTRQLVEITCSKCAERLIEEPPICCKCIDERATCNNNMAEDFGRSGPGATCKNELDCSLFGDCDDSCNEVFIDVKQSSVENCPFGQKTCCDAVGNELFSTIGQNACSGSGTVEEQKLLAVQDFSLGVTCGKRDSRVYHSAGLPESFTNPGEWPWSVLIYDGDQFIGAGALVDNTVVVTAAHKVRDFVNRPFRLRARLGDWNPNGRDDQEDFEEVTMEVDCVRIHPDADLDGTLANNVAVLILRKSTDIKQSTVAAVVVQFRNAEQPPRRPADRPEGVEGFNRIQNATSPLSVRLGLIAGDRGLDPLGGGSDVVEIAESYINTICLPRDREQFEGYTRRCWVASWGQNQERQREVDLPILSRSECSRRLRPEFESRGVNNWSPQPSELCAGGEPEKDTCRGEGGAPLVCYDESFDQYYLVGLVGYGFDCNRGIPGVYTNMADPGVQDFVREALRENNGFC